MNNILKKIIEENHKLIVDETAFHIRRLIPEYSKISDNELKDTLEEAYNAISMLITENNYKGITLFLDGIIKRRNMIGIGIRKIRKTIMIFRDVLVSKIIFNRKYSEEVISSILENVDKLATNIDERLSAIYLKTSPKKEISRLYKTTVDSLSIPVIIFDREDFSIIYSNRAMDKFFLVAKGEKITDILRKIDSDINLEKLEEQLLITGRCEPLFLNVEEKKIEIVINMIEDDSVNENYSVLTILNVS